MRLSCQSTHQTSCDQQLLSCCASQAVLVAIVAAPLVLLSASKSLGEANFPSEASNALLRVDAERAPRGPTPLATGSSASLASARALAEHAGTMNASPSARSAPSPAPAISSSLRPPGVNAGPVAVIKLPQWVPRGLHGNRPRQA